MKINWSDENKYICDQITKLSLHLYYDTQVGVHYQINNS